MTESSSISIQLVKAFEADVPEYDYYLLNQLGATENELRKLCLLPLGPVVVYYIFPDISYAPPKHSKRK